MTSVLYDVAGPRARRRTAVYSIVAGAAILALLAVVVRRLQANGQLDRERYEPFYGEVSDQVWTLLLESLLYGTLQAAAYALVLASLLGALLAGGRLSKHRWLRWPSIGVIEFFRGVPLLLLIFFFFLGFPLAFGINLEPLWSVVLGLTLYNGAVIAEIIRAGVLSLPRGQAEAAAAVGLNSGQTMRLVLLPQAVRVMLPALISQLIVLLKDTSLGYIIGFVEILRRGRLLANNPQLDNTLQMLLVVALIFIVVNVSLSKLATWVEGRERAKFGRSTPGLPAGAASAT